MSEKRDIPWSTPGFPHTLNNEDLLAYIRYTSTDKAAADTLKSRWESFWEKDYQKLKEFRFQIDRLILDQTNERQSHFKETQELSELRKKLAEYESGRKTAALRATVRKLEKQVRGLTEERGRLKKARPVPVEFAAREHALRSEIRELKAKVQQMGWSIAELRRVKSIGSFMITPPFEIFDHPKAHPSSTEVARMARILHDRE